MVLLTAAHPAALRRARGRAALRALGGLLAGRAGVPGRRGARPTWGPPARVAPHHLTATG
ncbi:hypothetical protein [Streptomyces tropicalis]|uniref:Uncharacterized protein n=1 Tax=Streptomyces tropicalis TaxID=3034234 RepID=A0ABT6A0L4_9ACTN|nr:hypothetical protein [Streptomyces tropicalis]MDF3297365.1 hypothetical protein [Streptomyces tropicalis]